MSERRRAQYEMACLARREKIRALGLEVTPSVGNFVLIHFRRRRRGRRRRTPTRSSSSAASCCGSSSAYQLPDALRMTVGTEEANRLVGRALGEFLNGAGPWLRREPAIFERLALIGVGLIGSSIARAARANGAARIDRGDGPLASDAQARAGTRPRRSGGRDQRRGGQGTPISSSSARRSAPAARSRPRSAPRSNQAPSSPTSARSKARSCATWPRMCRRTRTSCRRIRSPAPSIRARMPASPSCFENRWCILTPPARRRRRGGREAASASGRWPRRQCRDHGRRSTTISCSPITSHLPHLIAYNIVGTAADLEDVTELAR